MKYSNKVHHGCFWTKSRTQKNFSVLIILILHLEINVRHLLYVYDLLLTKLLRSIYAKNLYRERKFFWQLFFFFVEKLGSAYFSSQWFNHDEILIPFFFSILIIFFNWIIFLIEKYNYKPPHTFTCTRLPITFSYKWSFKREVFVRVRHKIDEKGFGVWSMD